MCDSVGSERAPIRFRNVRLGTLIPVEIDRVLRIEPSPVRKLRRPHDVPTRIRLDLLIPIPDAHPSKNLPFAVALLAQISIATAQHHRRGALEVSRDNQEHAFSLGAV